MVARDRQAANMQRRQIKATKPNFDIFPEFRGATSPARLQTDFCFTPLREGRGAGP
ncbi:hypothetical protein FRAHR75_590015 [Frankia sp. Hr75.2]|nr:hypothetical protein FRAHR75_590015 [Frankia sp. Hr75.2]SQD97914.1 hypothetical protein FMEAI12_4370031 [Parafrankia sp. Ea1.12]